LNFDNNITNYGTINLLASGLNHTVEIEGSSLNNVGTLNINPGPTADGSRIIYMAVNNSGTINVNANTTVLYNSVTNTGTINIAAGKMLSMSTGSSETFTQSAGSLIIQGALHLPLNDFILQGGTMEVDGQALVGALQNNSAYYGGSGSASGLSIPGGTLTIASRFSNSQTNNLSLASLSITAGGSFDLTNNDLIIQYSDPAIPTAVESYLASGYADGTWTGSGIVSSTAAEQANHATTLGYIDTGAQILIDYTWLGDTNLDGIVNFADLAAISSTGTTWAAGDFNYDGQVNADDYALFQLGAAESGGANISNILPEPIAITLLAPTFVFRRRRRG
jgi:hypothetical protein